MVGTLSWKLGSCVSLLSCFWREQVSLYVGKLWPACNACRNVAAVRELLFLLLNQLYVCRSLPGAARHCLSLGQHTAGAADAAHSGTGHPGPVRSTHPAVSCSLRAQRWGGAANTVGEGCHLGSHTYEIEGNWIWVPISNSRFRQRRTCLFSC